MFTLATAHKQTNTWGMWGALRCWEHHNVTLQLDNDSRARVLFLLHVAEYFDLFIQRSIRTVLPLAVHRPTT